MKVGERRAGFESDDLLSLSSAFSSSFSPLFIDRVRLIILACTLQGGRFHAFMRQASPRHASRQREGPCFFFNQTSVQEYGTCSKASSSFSTAIPLRSSSSSALQMARFPDLYAYTVVVVCVWVVLFPSRLPVSHGPIYCSFHPVVVGGWYRGKCG